MKNKGKIATTLLISALLIIYGAYFIKNQQKLTLQQFKIAEKDLLNTLQQEAAEGNYQPIQSISPEDTIILLIPTNGQAAIINDVQKDMTKLAKDLLKKETKKMPTKTVLTATARQIQPNISQYEYVKKNYDWNKDKQKWNESTETLKERTLINNLTGNKLTLGDIFINQQNLLKLQRTIQEELLEDAPDSQKAVDAILALPPLLAAETDFTYGQTKLSLSFRQKNTYINSYTINYEQVGRFLNPDFVDALYLKETPVEKVVLQDKVVALTFDDGPSDKTTPTVLAVLKKKKVPATFFLLGQQVEKFPDIVNTIADDGHELANHSYSHPNLTSLSAEETRQQINQTQAAIYKASGRLPNYVRPPYGSFNYETAVAIGLPLVNWSVDSLDWKTKNSQKITQEITATIQPNSIILMHDIQQATTDALEKLVTDLQKDGYRFVTVSDLLQVTASPLTVYYTAIDLRTITND